MVPIDEVLIRFAVASVLLAGEVVGNISLLEQDVAAVLLVVQSSLSVRASDC